MKTSIGMTWIMGLMIGFILLFSSYIVLNINYNKTLKVKNEVLSVIEKYQGLNSASLEIINNYLYYSSYMAKGYCVNDGETGTGVYGATSLNSDAALVPADSNTKYYYCVKKYKTRNKKNYYQVVLFYKFNVPVVRVFSGFVVRGTSVSFKAYDDDAYSDVVGG